MEDWTAGVRYRCAFGTAARLAEAEGHGELLSGRERGKGGPADAVRAEAVRRFGDSAEVAEAVEDALEGRRPRW